MNTAKPRWVSCSIKEFGEHNGGYRHLSYRGSLDTLCGFSASHPEIWRYNRVKHPCPICEALEK